MTYDGTELRIDDSGLTLYGENIARTLSLCGKISGRAVSKELRKNIRLLQNQRAYLTAKYAGAEAAPPAAEWLLDNSYLAVREGLAAAREIEHAGALPRAKSTAALFELCRALVRSDGGRVTRTRSRLFLEGCQSFYILSRRELSLFIPILKAAAILELAALYASDITAFNAAFAAERLFSTLRSLSTLDFSEVLEAVDKTEKLFSSDPAGIYPLMSEKTKNYYKRRVEKLAKAKHTAEHRIAEKVLRLSRSSEGEARHVGYYLFTKPLGEKSSAPNGQSYITVNILLTIFISLILAAISQSPLAALLLLFPISELVKSLIDFILLRIAPPAHIPRLELKTGVPKSGRTLCVISALLTNESSGAKLSRRLEEFHLANRDAGENLLFGILADLPDADTRTAPQDEKIIFSVKACIDALNQKYGGGFFFLIRERSFCEADGRYIAWERKRGAIMQLAHLLCGDKNTLNCLSGSLLSLRGVPYILTLDEDTRLTPGTAKELIGAMLHPLNTPVIDEALGKVVFGHALIHTRMTAELSSCNKSRFSRIFAGQGGSDPYGSDSCELYMDVFQNGGFAGKGIINAEALLRCMGARISDNQVLSHDALEGAYLRGGYMGDTELLDSFPSDILAYYRRQHRWIRGDFQNLPWLFRRGKALTDLDRYRLFDSVRRALTAPMAFIAMLCAFFMPTPGLTLAALFAMLSLIIPLIASSIEQLFRDERDVKMRCYSSAVRGASGSLMQTLLRLMFLPFEAYVSLTAAVSALWRMLISHKNLLNWTPASVLDAKPQSVFAYYVRMWLSPLIGLILLFFAPSVIGKAAGIIWIFSPPAALSISKPLNLQAPISVADKNYLLLCAKDIWSFFEDFCTAEDHYLPPDNWQERPPVGTAHRTSPTNIGLCLISCLSAIDLKLTRPHTALGIIENILATLRRIEKWNGHLYNWYDTRTLKPLHPNYVSTVDSGNLAACLIILREGLYEQGEVRLAEACNELLAPMSFAPLYDRDHHLFSIGIDLEKGEKSRGLYDLMASEARTAGFIAIARGDIPRRHWKSLSRAQVSHKGYRGMVSWTGTMFEYLMPRLFFTSPRNSLMYESIRFCLGVQKDRTAEKKLPWGISESAFFALDPALNYRYKAHGCAALALKRNMDSELVVSPYSSFLALCCGTKAPVANLRALERYGSLGKYGFWEAVDFTESRVPGHGGEAVHCVMAHHLGMSLAAISNALCNDILPRRLMRDPSISAHSCLLEEALPLGGVLLQRKEPKAPEKPPRSGSIYWEKRGCFTDFAAPACCVLSNGSYSIMSTDSGISHARCGEIIPYFTPPEAPSTKHGIELWLKREAELIPLLPTPDMDKDTKTDWEFTLSAAKISLDCKNLHSQVLMSVSSAANGEKRIISVNPKTAIEQNCELLVMFEPVLAPYNDYVNHPAFYRLGLHAKRLGDTLIIRRLKRGTLPEQFLCLAASAPMELSARREALPGRGGLLAASEKMSSSALGWLSDPLVCAKIPIRLSQGSESAVSFVLTVGASENEAYTAACRMLTGDSADISSFPADSAAGQKMSETQVSDAMELLNTITYPAPGKCENARAKSELWHHGVSGDLPIITREITDPQNLPAIEALMKQHAFLCSLSRPFDLVLITNEGGDYLRPISSALSELKSAAGKDSSKIHITDHSTDIECLLSSSALPRERAFNNEFVRYVMSTDLLSPSQAYPQYHWNSDNSFTFYVNHSLPPRSWGNMLTNGSFGFFATDCGTGHMWYKNAREYHINRWLCEPLSTNGTETLELCSTPRESLFAGPSDTSSTVCYGFGFAEWKKCLYGLDIKTTAFVPRDIDARVLILEWEGAGVLPIAWYTDLILSGEAYNNGRVTIKQQNGAFIAANPDSPFPDSPFTVCHSSACTGFTSSRSLWLQGKTDDSFTYGEGLGLCFEAKSPFVLVCGCDDCEKLKELANPRAALSALNATRKSWQSSVSTVEIKTPLPALDRLINGWLPYQAIACRLMGRCSIYQSGGAFGFRDQLQDAINLILINPTLAREQILESCRHQYEQGDVMHWWHTLGSSTKGVRTHCSDDLLWLPWALCEYVEKTGEISLCSTPTPWLNSEILAPSEHDRYEIAVNSEASSNVLAHAQKALDLVLERGTGEHGLLKFGGGDWNDGMDKIGINGMGESVWLTWFFSSTAHSFAALLRKLDKQEDAEKYESAAISLGISANAAWDGDHYLRGYFDNGTPLGASSSSCCQIDSVAQSFSALCPEADASRVDTSLTSAVSRLHDVENQLIRLFDPPFEDFSPNPGYIESYGPGFRENGGQYTHGAIWLIMALLRQDRSNEALELISDLLPDNRDGKIYEAEPYVIAADVSSCPDCAGRAGWSFYTGSAAWLFRVITEDLLGLHLQDGKLKITPKLPSDWPSCEIRIKNRNASLRTIKITADEIADTTTAPN
ncbi:MAG: glucoamylase family protein [Oscillospiraceae bacterium]